MNEVFLDTVGLIAVWDASDQWHSAADTAFQQLLKAGHQLISTPFILLESGNAAARRPYRNRVNVLRQNLAQADFLVEPTAQEIEDAWAAYDRGDAGQAGIVDQVSFIVMRRLGIMEAFTNDRHFHAAGFKLLF